MSFVLPRSEARRLGDRFFRTSPDGSTESVLPLAAVVAPRLPTYSSSESVFATRSRPRWRYDWTARRPDSIPVCLLGRSVIPLEIALEQGGHV